MEPNPGNRVSSLGAATLIGLCLLATLALPARAEPIRVSADLTPAAAAAPLRISGGAVHLTLEEAIALALDQNLSLRVVRYDQARARENVAQALGIYDFLVQGGLQLSSDTVPAASNLDGAEVQESDRAGFQLGLSRLLPTGGTAEVNWVNGRFKTNSRFSILNPSYSSGLNLVLNQPLLRDSGREATERGIVIARNNREISRLAFVQRVTDLLREVEEGYWNLVEARYQLQVSEAALDLARRLHEQNRVRVDVGTLAPLELVQSEVGIATREEEIIRARFAVGNAEDRLRQLLGLDRDAQLWAAEIVPESEAEISAPLLPVEKAIDRALDSRPELASRRTTRRNLEIEAAWRRNQLLPRVDLQATYKLNGVGGDVLVRSPDGSVIASAPGGWDDALQQVADLDYRGWTVGIGFSYPLGNRSARAQQASAELAVEQASTQEQELELSIATEVRTAVRAVEAAAKAIESAKASRRLAEKNLEAEQRKYENGLSTSFQVLQIQDDLTAARSRVVSAVSGYRRALAAYRRALGTLLEESHVTVLGDEAAEG
ncbi:MAG: TolC family protein [Thermoanaerobaculia bacterium]|nr:TolC family protein [Thermoanaerobaculia bacterium]MDI9630747.1 TolC family protein [Acidobacteriota bacterium]MBP7813949.1 TolC family protein [Thermoanaerobaculia bacterium]MBP8845696.1 TolC family protein [Thermoanaerobaculia bacterium]HPA95106.1 TolC family protein [Thermoanaerobaculia bacterium]